MQHQSRLVPWRSIDHAQNGEETEGNCKDSPIAGEVEEGSRRLEQSGGEVA